LSIGDDNSHAIAAKSVGLADNTAASLHGVDDAYQSTQRLPTVGTCRNDDDCRDRYYCTIMHE
jgi:hypothetical protein